MLVFTRRGVESRVIDEVITTAEVSRGTFYNYFQSTDELLAAVAEEVGNALMAMIFVGFGAVLLVVLTGGAYLAWRDTFGDAAPPSQPVNGIEV